MPRSPSVDHEHPLLRRYTIQRLCSPPKNAEEYAKRLRARQSTIFHDPPLPPLYYSILRATLPRTFHSNGQKRSSLVSPSARLASLLSLVETGSPTFPNLETINVMVRFDLEPDVSEVVGEVPEPFSVESMGLPELFRSWGMMGYQKRFRRYCVYMGTPPDGGVSYQYLALIFVRQMVLLVGLRNEKFARFAALQTTTMLYERFGLRYRVANLSVISTVAYQELDYPIDLERLAAIVGADLQFGQEASCNNNVGQWTTWIGNRKQRIMVSPTGKLVYFGCVDEADVVRLARYVTVVLAQVANEGAFCRRRLLTNEELRESAAYRLLSYSQVVGVDEESLASVDAGGHVVVEQSGRWGISAPGDRGSPSPPVATATETRIQKLIQARLREMSSQGGDQNATTQQVTQRLLKESARSRQPDAASSSTTTTTTTATDDSAPVDIYEMLVLGRGRSGGATAAETDSADQFESWRQKLVAEEMQCFGPLFLRDSADAGSEP